MKIYDKQYINGQWREGTSEKVMENRNPYTGELIYSYRAASTQDIDDAYALVSAVKMECFDILGITTVYRNSLQRAKIASALLQALGKTDIGVYAGNDYPYKERFCVEPFETVLPDGRPVIPHYFSEFENMPVSRKSATDFIVEQAEKYPGEVVVVAIGPLTNLAETVRKFPESFAKLAEIVCMGGSFTNDVILKPPQPFSLPAYR